MANVRFKFFYETKMETKYKIISLNPQMKKTILAFLFLLLVNTGFSQGEGKTFNGIKDCYKKTMSLSVHILLDTLGQKNISDASIQAAIANLNSVFSPTCASFEICETFVHPNVRNDKVRMGIEDKEISTMYNVANTINVYFVQEFIGGENPCGFAPLGGMVAPPYTADRDAIFILKSCVSGKTIPHEFGHYFGLYHTFEKSFGVELANASNCKTAGDLICDTPGDPYPTGTMTSQCYLSPGVADSNGEYYTPDACNIMSYYNNPCDGFKFTTGQYNRMLDVMKTGRNYLW